MTAESSFASSGQQPRLYLSAHGADTAKAAEAARSALEARGWRVIRETLPARTRGQCRKVYGPRLRDCDAFVQLVGWDAGPMLKAEEDDDSRHSLATWEAREASALRKKCRRILLADEFPFDSIAEPLTPAARRFQASQRHRLKCAPVRDLSQLVSLLEDINPSHSPIAEQGSGLAAQMEREPAAADMTEPPAEPAPPAITLPPEIEPALPLNEEMKIERAAEEKTATVLQPAVSESLPVDVDNSGIHPAEDAESKSAANHNGTEGEVIDQPLPQSEADDPATVALSPAESPMKDEQSAAGLAVEFASNSPANLAVLPIPFGEVGEPSNEPVAESAASAAGHWWEQTPAVPAGTAPGHATITPAVPLKKETCLLLPRRVLEARAKPARKRPRIVLANRMVASIDNPADSPQELSNSADRSAGTPAIPDAPVSRALHSLDLHPQLSGESLADTLHLPSEREPGPADTGMGNMAAPDIERHLHWPVEMPDEEDDGPAPHPMLMPQRSPAGRRPGQAARIQAIAALLVLSLGLSVFLAARASRSEPREAAQEPPLAFVAPAPQQRAWQEPAVSARSRFSPAPLVSPSFDSFPERLAAGEERLDALILELRSDGKADPAAFAAKHSEQVRELRGMFFALLNESSSSFSPGSAGSVRLACRLASLEMIGGRHQAARNVLLDARDHVSSSLGDQHAHALVIGVQLAMLDVWQAAFEPASAGLAGTRETLAAARNAIDQLSRKTGSLLSWSIPASADPSASAAMHGDSGLCRSLLVCFPMTDRELREMCGDLVVRAR